MTCGHEMGKLHMKVKRSFRLWKRHLTCSLSLSSEVPDYDVAHPFLTDNEAAFSSNNLHQRSRQRRDLGQDDPIFLDALGKRFHLKVSKSDDILAPGAKVKIIEADGKINVREPLRLDYYQGHVLSDPNSIVAISNDGTGLVGSLSSSVSVSTFREGYTTYGVS